MPERATKQGGTKNLNVPLPEETWARLYRIQDRIKEMHGWLPCSQQRAIEYIIEHCRLGDVAEPKTVKKARTKSKAVPLPPPRRKKNSHSHAARA